VNERHNAWALFTLGFSHPRFQGRSQRVKDRPDASNPGVGETCPDLISPVFRFQLITALARAPPADVPTRMDLTAPVRFYILIDIDESEKEGVPREDRRFKAG
jgi:hypothetical protein